MMNTGKDDDWVLIDLVPPRYAAEYAAAGRGLTQQDKADWAAFKAEMIAAGRGSDGSYRTAWPEWCAKHPRADRAALYRDPPIFRREH
jgi:hypothetical protein